MIGGLGYQLRFQPTALVQNSLCWVPVPSVPHPHTWRSRTEIRLSLFCPFSPDKMGRKRAVAWAHSSLGASREALVIKVLGAAAGGTLIPLQEATCPQKKDMAQHWQEAKYFCQ